MAIPHVDDHVDLPGRYKLLSRFPSWGARPSKSAAIILHHLPQNVLVGRHFCQFQIPDYPAKIMGKGSPGRPWCIPRWHLLQYWAKKANPPKPDELHLLARCIHELRQAMRPFTTFTDGAVFEGITPRQGTLQEGATKPSTMETTQTPVPERRPATSPEKLTTPLAKELDIPVTASGELAAELTKELAAPPTPPEMDKKVKESPACELPGWTEIHPSCLVTPVGESLQIWGTGGSTTSIKVLVGEGPDIIGWKNKGTMDRGLQFNFVTWVSCAWPLSGRSTKSTTTWLQVDCPVFEKRSTPMSHHQGSSGADATQSLDRTYHDHVDVNKDKLRWGNWHHIHGHGDSLNGESSLEDFLQGGWPLYAYAGGGCPGWGYCCHRCHQSMDGR